MRTALEIVGTEHEAPDDLELIAAANQGDSAAFEALYRKHRDWVVNLAYRFTADREMSLDILQETFLYFAKKFPGFTLTCQLRSFLYPVVKNLAVSAGQKARRYQSGEELFLTLEAPAAALEGDEDELRAALASLPAAQREVLVLRFLEGMSLAEISETLEIPVGPVKSRLHHALESLRQNPNTKKLLE